MFAKLKESKFFKLLSATLCSIEIVETKNMIPPPRHYPNLPSTSTPHPNGADKAIHKVP